MPIPENIFPRLEEKIPPGCTPPDWYASVFSELHRGKPWAYVIESLTSSGFRKALKGQLRKPQQLHVIVNANGKLAEDIGAQYFDNTPYSFIFPHWIGKRHHADGELWTEFDYLSNFYFLLTGMTPEDARDVYAQARSGLSPAIQVMDDHTLPREERRSAYEHIAQELLSSNRSSFSDHNPVQAAFAMPGSQDSLGCNVERAIVREIGLPLTEIPVPTTFDTHALRHAQRVGVFD